MSSHPQIRSINHHRAIMAAAAAVVVLVAVGLTVLVLGTTHAQQTAPPLAGPAPQSPVSSAPTDAGESIQPAPVIGEADLQRQVNADRAVAEGLVGYWVPQLSSKQLGRVVDGVTFSYPAILADFQALHTRFPQSVLIRSADYSSYARPGFWVTVVAETYASADDVNTWCDSQGFAADGCYAHRLSHTDGPAGNSKPR